MTESCRGKSPTRAEAMAKLLVPKPYYDSKVLVGNWVEGRITCPKDCNLYFPPKDNIDYEKMQPELRRDDFRLNKMYSINGTVLYTLKHESHESSGNFSTTNDLIYKHMTKPLCGPPKRYYKRCSYYPQTDLLKSFGNMTEWGLRQYKEYEWATTDVSDYATSLYEDTFTAPRMNQYLPSGERKARRSDFTKTFLHKMTKSKT